MLKSNKSTSCDTNTRSNLLSFISLLSINNSPFSNGYNPAKIFITVVFPWPDSPIILILSPLCNINSGIFIFVESLEYENTTLLNLVLLKSLINFTSLLFLKYSSSCFLAFPTIRALMNDVSNCGLPFSSSPRLVEK